MTTSKEQNESESKSELSPEDLVERLHKALGEDGDFPASARIITELRDMTSNPHTTAHQITELILKEPSLGTRVLHVVNSALYQRSKPIMTVTQAVVQLGMQPLAELCSGLVLLQRFVPHARRGGPFANCLKKMVLTSMMSSAFATEMSLIQGGKSNEFGYLAGTFSELGSLLLAYYFPKLYDNAVKRAENKKQDLNTALYEITGMSSLKVSIEVLDALGLPEFYREVMSTADDLSPLGQKKSTQPTNVQEHASDSESDRIAKALSASRLISESLISGKNQVDFDKVLQSANSIMELPPKSLANVLSGLKQAFESHCSTMGLALPSLPDFLASYCEEGITSSLPQDNTAQSAARDSFLQFVDEIRLAVENREPTSAVITTVMETLAWSLKFDRVLLMLVGNNRSVLNGRMLLGQAENFDPKRFTRQLSEKQRAESIAFRESRPISSGEPVLEGGWPFIAFPIGSGNRSIGVIYADRTSGGSALTEREQAAIGLLTDLLERSTTQS